jgi:acyl carrier protein
MELIEGYRADALWVPVSYERVRVHGALPPKIVSWVRTSDDAKNDSEFAAFDVVLADESGRVLVEVEKLTLRKLAGEPDFALSRRPSSDVERDPDDQDREPSAAERQLQINLERGILPAEGQEAFARALASGEPRLIVSSLDVAGLARQVEQANARPREDGLKLARPELDSEYVEPEDEIEKTLVGFWQELLGVDRVGVRDSFFDLGGHSLIAVRLFAKVKKAFSVEFPISVLFVAPTIERCAELVRAKIGGAPASATVEPARPRYTHLVAMHPGEGGPKRPFFLVAGMFGNVLNLRHLANLLGTDRRFYGLQARGLYGEQRPHETFAEMAEAYIAEMRTVQPHGPYLLGGFSGGGITAYEIAQHLTRAGEEVALLVMLDTPLPFPPPKLSARDRALIQVQQLRARGPSYVGEWAVRRVSWEVG